MTTDLKPAPRAAATPEQKRRDREAAERRPVVVGIIGTILLHLLLVALAPFIKPGLTPPLKTAEGDVTLKEQEFNISLNPDDLGPKPRPEFVEVNPDAPEIQPEKTNQTGAKDQKVAQPDPGKDETEKPKTEGKLDQSTAIVSGERAEPMNTPPPGNGGQGQSEAEMQAAMVAGDAKVRQAETPLPGFEKITGDNPDGVGTSFGDDPNTAKKDVEKKIEGQQKDTGETAEPQVVVNATVPATSAAPGRPGPRPRPKVPNTRPAVLANQPMSTSNYGTIRGVNSRISEYGDYMQKFIEIVDLQWNRLLSQSKVSPPRPSQVTVKFRLGKDGQIWEVLEVIEGGDKPSTYMCIDAIRTPAPYEKWPDDMVAIFGDSDVITFVFYYQ